MDDRIIVDPIVDPSDWIVSDLIKESAAEATVPPQELPYTHLSPSELIALLEKHREWLESRGSRGARFDFARADLQALDFTGVNLQGANLNKANFRGAELLLADLRGASLVQADLREANVLGTDFRGANLEGACLEGVAGLSTLRMARANLFSAILPASISIFEGESAASIRMQKCYRFLIIMLAVTAVCLVRILTTRDIQFLRDAPTVPIPRLGNLLPLSVFYLIVPVILFGMFLYFHLSLANLQESLAGLPAVFPDGHIAERRGPWLLTELVRIRANDSGWSWKELRIQSIIAALLAYWSVPAVLLVFWARYLVMQDLHASMMHILLIAVSLAVATVLPQLMKNPQESPIARAPSVSIGEEEIAKEPAAVPSETEPTNPDPSMEVSMKPSTAPVIDRREKVRHGSALPRTIAIGSLAVLLGLLTFGIVYGAPSDTGTVDFGKANMRRWASEIFWALGYGPYARLNESTVSELPKKWSWLDGDLAEVKGPQLNKLRLRYVQGYQTIWVNAHLWKADLRGSYLSDSDFRGANLREANLRSSEFDHSRLYRANLQSADLESADFTRADLRETDLSYAQLGNAILVDAQLDHSNLFRADLHSVRLEHSNLQNADLRDANLANANLRLANLQNAYLWSAKLMSADLSDAQGARAILIEADLRGANVRQANLRGAILRGANFSGADISGADVREVSGLSADQVCSTKAHRNLIMDQSLSAEVDAQCGASAIQAARLDQLSAAGSSAPAGTQ
jgi:uncharacterized protein YjbI with pentapeptide repeats